MDKIRTCFFRPYRARYPFFRLDVFDTFSVDQCGKSVLAYSLKIITGKGRSTVIFEGRDFHCSPMHGIDSDACMASLMHFLTLRPGDTDVEHFADYTAEQLAYVSEHAESLSACVEYRFPDCA